MNKYKIRVLNGLRVEVYNKIIEAIQPNEAIKKLLDDELIEVDDMIIIEEE